MNPNYFPVLAAMCRAYEIDVPEEEYLFARPRKFRFDFAWPDAKLALEVEGGIYSQGRHTRPSGFLKDMEKYNLAVMKGWRVLRITPKQVKKWETIDMIARALEVTHA